MAAKIQFLFEFEKKHKVDSSDLYGRRTEMGNVTALMNEKIK